MADEVIQSWPDGHSLSRDTWQHIITHPRSCKNAGRGGNAYAKHTYFVNATDAQAELRACHPVVGQA